MNLSPRLSAVAGCIPQGCRLTDVGTDHGYLPVALLQKGQIASAIATDLREGPLNTARETVERWGVRDRVDLRLCDGLAAVSPEETDAVAIAGMGGETILAILEASPWALDKTCIVQPMSSQEDLRAGLERVNGRILREKLVRERETLYIIMELGRGAEQLTPAECWFGKAECHKDDPLWPEYFEHRSKRAEKSLKGLKKSGKPEDLPRKCWLEEVLGGSRSLRP